MSVRIKVGHFIPHVEEGFERRLRAFLESEGELSAIEGRGLEVIPMRHKSAPGSNPLKIGEALNSARSPLSMRKLLNRIPDLNERELHRAIMKMVRNGEVRAEPKTMNRYKYFLYSLTDRGAEALIERREKYEAGKPVALEIWRVFKTQGLQHGQGVDRSAIRRAMRSTMDDKEFGAGWNTLVDSGRIDVAYNADGPGKNRYYLA